MTAPTPGFSIDISEYEDHASLASLMLQQLEHDNARLKAVVAELLVKNQWLRWELNRQELDA